MKKSLMLVGLFLVLVLGFSVFISSVVVAEFIDAGNNYIIDRDFNAIKFRHVYKEPSVPLGYYPYIIGTNSKYFKSGSAGTYVYYNPDPNLNFQIINEILIIVSEYSINLKFEDLNKGVNYEINRMDGKDYFSAFGSYDNRNVFYMDITNPGWPVHNIDTDYHGKVVYWISGNKTIYVSLHHSNKNIPNSDGGEKTDFDDLLDFYFEKYPPITITEETKSNCDNVGGICRTNACFSGEKLSSESCFFDTDICCVKKEIVITKSNCELAGGECRISCFSDEKLSSESCIFDIDMCCIKEEVTEEEIYCTDSDGGKNYNEVGVINFISLGEDTSRQDTCYDQQILVEYFCEEDMARNEAFDCQNGCSNGKCLEKNEEELEEVGEVDKEIKPILSFCDNGCISGEICYPLGYRTSDKYCGLNNEFLLPQLSDNAQCNNSFECKSNVCISGQCIEQSLIQRILDFFRRLFG